MVEPPIFPRRTALMDTESDYHVPTGVTAVAGVFLALGALFALINLADIVWRRGWKTMMWIMIPVYVINSTYMGPLSLYLYFKYGRPKSPEDIKEADAAQHSEHQHHGEHEHSMFHEGHTQHTGHDVHVGDEMEKEINGNHNSEADMEQHNHHHDDTIADVEKAVGSETGKPEQHQMPDHSQHSQHHHHHHMDDSLDRPFWALVFIGVAHCGAGCVLGDIVGEWIVYGSDVTINGRDVWPALLIDYAFALFFGIFFQYFTIAPMSGEYGVKTLVRAAKADILSLTAFEVGLFGWMVAYQVGIWEYRLEMNTWAYWWQMQIGMFFGFWTSVPVNWWLIKNNIKEPCV